MLGQIRVKDGGNFPELEVFGADLGHALSLIGAVVNVFATQEVEEGNNA